jgi:hypothetical protein
MAEWTIDITSEPGALPADRDPADVLEQLAEAIEANPFALGPSVSANTAAGTVSGVFQVEARSFFDAMRFGQAAWLAAQERAGITPTIGTYEQRPASPESA